MVEKKKVSKKAKKITKKKVIKVKKRIAPAIKQKRRGRPKGSVVKKRKQKTKQGIEIPIGKEFKHQTMIDLIGWMNKNSSSKKTLAAATDGYIWWLAFV